MAYISTNLNLVYDSPSQVKRWEYVTTDSFATVCGSTYFNDAASQGMAPGDLVTVTVFTSTLPDGTLATFVSSNPAVVSTVTSSGGTIIPLPLPATSLSGLGTGVGTALGNALNGTGGLLSVTLGTGVATALAQNVSGSGGGLALTTSPSFTTPALGTPSGGTLTNCSGLPVSGITPSTSTALGVGSIELGHASDTTISRLAAGVPGVEGKPLVTAGKHTIWIPASAMVARTTNGAASGTAETTTNKVMLKTLDFDATTQEYAQCSVRMPKSWDEGTVTFAPTWTHPSTTTNFGVVWSLAGVALSNDDAADTAFGTAQTSTDTGGTTQDIYVGPESAAITIGNSPAAEDWVVYQISRVVADGGDTMAVDANLIGVTLYITTDAATDA